jgi:hypothetical protein
MAFRFRVFTMGGDDRPDLVTAVPNWGIGDVIHRGPGQRERVVDVVSIDPKTGQPFDESSPYVALLFVEPA